MGFPLSRLQDKTKSFPIRPLSVYILCGHISEKQLGKCRNFISRAPYTLLPLEYIFIRNKDSIDINSVAPNDILKELAFFNIVTRNVDIEECVYVSDPNSILGGTFEYEHSIGYIGGTIDWNFFPSFEMAILNISNEVILAIKSQAERALNMTSSISPNEICSEGCFFNSFKKIIELCERSIAVLSRQSRSTLKNHISEFRDLLDMTSIMRRSPDSVDEDLIRTSFEQGQALSNQYEIVVKRTERKTRTRGSRKIEKTNKYQINLTIGGEEFPIKSTEQSVILYMAAIAFSYRGECLARDILIRTDFVTPSQRNTLEVMNCCYLALKGIDVGNLKDVLEKKQLDHTQMSGEFRKWYENLCVDSNGEFDKQKLVKILSRLNNEKIPNALKGMPKEIWDMFSLRYVDKGENSYYELNIPSKNIKIE